MNTYNPNDFDEMFDKLEKNAHRGVKTINRGALAIAITVLVVAVVLTIVGVVFALSVSPWFWIAVLITGGYSVITAIGMYLVSSAMKQIS